MSASARFLARRILPLFADIEIRGDVSQLTKSGCMLISNQSVKSAKRDALLQAAVDEVTRRIAAMLPKLYRGYYADFPRVGELPAKRANDENHFS